ncbi:MAG: zf-TFIIB domain-containing protein [Caldilineaceae bacterium]|nr:zf-TFIIB domain-containing protein [Caldilineaceae bacterium]
MNCENCGAPMRLVRDRDYWVCDYCTTFHFPQENQEGVRVLGESSHLDCPACQTRLVSAAISQLPVLYCPKCKGLLATPENFRRIVDLRRHTSQKTPHVLRPLEKTELARRLRCSNCHGQMDVHPYYGPGNAVIDSCGTCALIWLDHGELTVIVTAPEREIRSGGWTSQRRR